MAPHRPGDRIGPYRLLEDLGSGGMGTVFLAMVDDVSPRLRIGDRVALKIVHPDLVREFDSFTRFVQEAELGTRIRHENVVSTVDAGMDVREHGETVYLAMEYVDGRTLAEILADQGPLADGMCRRVGREVARGLSGIHRVGAVHGDLKPANVLMTPDEVVKVMDLGLAHLHGRALETSERGCFQGTILYAAPEQFGKPDHVDARADLYALGLVLYELATGAHPFIDDDARVVIRHHCETTAPPLTEVRPDISPFLSAVVAQLLAKDRDRRFRSARDVFVTLQRGEESRWWRRRELPAGTLARVSGLDALRAHRGTLLRGRDAELHALRQALDEARHGAGRVALVVGPPGIGRSRLLDAFVRLLALDADPSRIRVGVHHPGGSWTDAYRRALELPGADSRSELTPETAIEAALRDGEDGSVLILDELHASEPAGRDFFLELAAETARHPLLVVAAARDDVDRTFRAELEAMRHAQVLTLGPLDEHAIQAIMTDLSGDVPAELDVRCLRDRTGGHPAHVLGLLRGSGTATIDKAVRALILPRLRALSEEDRDIVEAAAILGSPFTAAQLSELTGTPEGTIARRLTFLERAERVFRSDGESWRFPFPAIKQAIRDALPDALRDAYRSEAAAVLDATSEDPARIALAWLVAGDVARAAPYLDAGLASWQDLPHRVVDLADRALACADELSADLLDRVRVHRATALLEQGRHADAAAALREMLSPPPDDS